MNSNFNEDEILTMLNDIGLSDHELNSENLTEIEKKKLKKNILSNIKPKKFKIKKGIIAASAAALIIITLPLFKTNNLNVIYSKIASINKGRPNTTTVIPNPGQITLANNTGLILNKSLKAQGITLNNLYIDKNKAIASITSDSFIRNYQSAKYTLKDSDGNIYNLKQTKLATGYGTSMTYKIEFNGSIKPSSNYTLSLIDNKVNFELTTSNFNEIHASKPLYTATSGNTTLNITSIIKNNNILRVDYYFTYKNTDGTKPSLSLLNPSCFKDDFTEDSYKDASYINNQIKENPNNSYLTIHDEYGNMNYGHSYTKTFGNESFFDLKKLKGNKKLIKLTIIRDTNLK